MAHKLKPDCDGVFTVTLYVQRKTQEGFSDVLIYECTSVSASWGNTLHHPALFIFNGFSEDLRNLPFEKRMRVRKQSRHAQDTCKTRARQALPACFRLGTITPQQRSSHPLQPLTTMTIASKYLMMAIGYKCREWNSYPACNCSVSTDTLALWPAL
jgi:hypothetical protein